MISPERVTVTNHAKLRWQQRVDPSEPFPAQQIRDLLERATPGVDGVDDGIGWEAGDVVIVTDQAKQAVKTIWPRGEGQ